MNQICFFEKELYNCKSLIMLFQKQINVVKLACNIILHFFHTTCALKKIMYVLETIYKVTLMDAINNFS